MKKSKCDIIGEIVSKYTSNPKCRASNDSGGCEYLTEDGRKCGVGHYLEHMLPNPTMSVWCAGNRTAYDACLVEEVRGHGLEFWGDIQNWHDLAHNWDDNGLTQSGHMAAVNLLVTWAGK